MLEKPHLEFILQALSAKDAQGRPIISVGVEHAALAADTWNILQKLLSEKTGAN